MARPLHAITPRPCRLLALIALALLAVSGLHAQNVPRPGLGTATPPGQTVEDPFRNNPELRARLERGRASERQKRMLDDANRLVALTTQYQNAIKAHGKPTEEDAKLLVQIEKVARDLKDRMRGM